MTVFNRGILVLYGLTRVLMQSHDRKNSFISNIIILFSKLCVHDKVNNT